MNAVKILGLVQLDLERKIRTVNSIVYYYLIAAVQYL